MRWGGCQALETLIYLSRTYMKSSYQISTLPVSSLFNLAEFTNRSIEENRQWQKNKESF